MSGGSFLNNVETNAPSDFLVTAVCWGAGLFFTAMLSWGVGLYAYRRGLWTKFMAKCRSLRTKCTSSKRGSGGQEQLPNQLHQSDPPLDPLRTPGHNMEAQEVGKGDQSGMAINNLEMGSNTPSTKLELADGKGSGVPLTNSLHITIDMHKLTCLANGTGSGVPLTKGLHVAIDMPSTKVSTRSNMLSRKLSREPDSKLPSESTDLDSGSDEIIKKTKRRRSRRRKDKKRGICNSTPLIEEETHGGGVSHNQGVLPSREQSLDSQEQQRGVLMSSMDDIVGQGRDYGRTGCLLKLGLS